MLINNSRYRGGSAKLFRAPDKLNAIVTLTGISHPLSRYCFVHLFAIVLMLAGCGSADVTNVTPSIKLSSINISPANVSIAANTSASLNATGVYSDGTTANITAQVTWSSANAGGVARVGANTGALMGVAAGTTSITATLSGVTSPVANITVTSAGGIAASVNTLTNARYDHTATLLTTGPNTGKVLVVGGYGKGLKSLNALSGVELYDPATDSWSSMVSLNFSRGDHTSVNLSDGRVLVTGGTDSNSLTLASSELFDPTTLSWSTTGNLNMGRSYNTITLLSNGQVLVAGGDVNSGTSNTAELYTSALDNTGTWTATGSMATARNSHTATLLASGKVLVAGGFNATATSLALTVSELYDPATATWTATGSLVSGVRYGHTATLLTTGPDAGKVLVVGGYGAGSSTLASAELYDPLTGKWTASGSLAVARTIHTATLLPNGKVLVMGGLDSAGLPLTSTEVYDPVTRIWTTTASLLTARDNFTATLLPNGKVLATGGNGATTILTNSELYW
jgi:N-acetylneuraminic acid mutarotase